jgi:hypothetical protein
VVKIKVVARATNRQGHIDLTGPMQSQLDLACMELAATQHWLITRDQVLDLGYPGTRWTGAGGLGS